MLCFPGCACAQWPFSWLPHCRLPVRGSIIGASIPADSECSVLVYRLRTAASIPAVNPRWLSNECNAVACKLEVKIRVGSIDSVCLEVTKWARFFIQAYGCVPEFWDYIQIFVELPDFIFSKSLKKRHLKMKTANCSWQ